MEKITAQENLTPVLIVGAGPSGLTMALELQRHGIPFRIIDKKIKPVPTSNALAAQTRTLEVWDDENLISAALTRGMPIYNFNGYANNKKIIDLNFKTIPSAFRFLLSISQHQTESMLLDRLQQKNILVEMNVELVDFSEGKRIAAVLRHPDGSFEDIQTSWLIACDGSHSIIRTKLNVPFVGKELPQHFILADVKIKSDLPPNSVNAFFSDQGPFALIQFDKDYYRIIAEVTHHPEFKTAKNISLDQLQQLARERCPLPLALSEPIWTSGFWIHERMIHSFSKENIFFMGDAAHIHSPVGGLGMNTGIQDAYNLAWKLAMVIQNKAPAKILSTYQTERVPVAKTVLRNTTMLTRIVTLHNSLLCRLRNFMIAQLLKNEKNRQKMLANMTQLTIRYSDNLLVKECLPKAKGPHAGSRMLYSSDPSSSDLMNHTRGIEHCLLFFTANEMDLTQSIQLKNVIATTHPGLCKFILIHKHNSISSWTDINILDVDNTLHELYHARYPCIYLVRPDKVIGFRGTMRDSEKLTHYLQIYHLNPVSQLNKVPI